MGKIKPVSMESNTFRQLKHDMTLAMNKLLKNMEHCNSEKASLSVKITICTENKDLGDGEVVVPTFVHKIGSAVQLKDERVGELNGEYALEKDGKDRYCLRVFSEQLEMFDDDDEDADEDEEAYDE